MGHYLWPDNQPPVECHLQHRVMKMDGCYVGFTKKRLGLVEELQQIDEQSHLEGQLTAYRSLDSKQSSHALPVSDR